MSRFVARHSRIALDTSVFIFQIEENAKYVGITNQLFRWLSSAKGEGVTSTITMVELLVHPYREKDDDRVDGFYALLSTYPNLAWIPTTLEIADRAAKLRAQHRLKTPDAIQAATAVASQATGFVSNDPAFLRVGDLDVLVLDDLLGSSKGQLGR